MRPRLAALVLVALSAASGSARADLPKPNADPSRIEEARQHMKAGAAFYNDASGHKCEEALREFRKAYELSGSVNALKGMAVCSLELERDGDAIEQYEAYLAGKGAAIEPAERAQVEADLAALRAAVATVTLSADRVGVRVTDVRTPAKGYPIRNTYPISPAGTRLAMHPGQHVLTASVDGAPDQVWSVEILNGSTHTHAFSFPDAPVGAPATSRPVPASVYVGVALTAALAVPWVVLAVRAKAKHDDYDELNGKAPRMQLELLRDQVKSANLLADVFLGATVASLTVTAALFFSRPTRPLAPPPPKAGSFVVSPTIGASFGGTVITGWF
jgi:hypothetical protein